MKQSSDTIQKKDNPAGTAGSVQSVSRALDLLEAFPGYGPEIGLTDIASLLGLDKATAYRLLATLEKRGYIERSVGSRRYRLGLRAFVLGAYYQNHLELRRVGLPFLHEIVQKTHEDAFLCIREGDDALCIERVEAENPVTIFSLRVGGKQPLHCGAAPRALLTCMTDEELTGYAIRTKLPALTPCTIQSVDTLITDVHTTRQLGYCVSLNDATIGIAAVGAPVFDHRGQLASSISLSGLAHRFESDRLAEYIQVIKDTAVRYSHQMGYTYG